MEIVDKQLEKMKIDLSTDTATRMWYDAESVI